MPALTVFTPDELPSILASFAQRLSHHPLALAILESIAASWPAPEALRDIPERRAAAIAQAHACGIATLEQEPAVSFSWDGYYLRVCSEPWVIFHEVAHWLLCPPQRRHLPDFGLGAGPESGWQEQADACLCADEHTKQEEETLASLLGVLLEVRCDGPGILAFVEQNWLEGSHRASAVAYFAEAVAKLRLRGFVASLPASAGTDQCVGRTRLRWHLRLPAPNLPALLPSRTCL